MERVQVRVEPLHPRHADALEELVLASGDPDRLAVAADLHDFLWIESTTFLAFGAPGLVGYLIGRPTTALWPASGDCARVPTSAVTRSRWR